MKPSEEAKLSLVRQWAEQAEKDYGLARHLVAEGLIYREAIGFHSQQTAEKLLKGFLVLHQIDFPKTHNLGKLLDLVAVVDSTLAETLRDITVLNPYGVEYRYPGDFPELSQDDAESAFRLAEKVFAAVMPRISPHLDAPRQAE